MEVFEHAGFQMLVLFTIVLLGAVARKRGLMNDTFDATLSRLVMTVALPGMILDSVLGNQNLPSSEAILMMMACSTAVYVIVCPIAFFVVRFLYRGVSKSARGAHAFLIAFGNTGFIGFAVLDAVFGVDAVLYGAIYNIPYNLFLYSVGLLFIMSSDDAGGRGPGAAYQLKLIAKQLVSPCLLSCFAAMALALLGITDSGFAGQACGLLGQMTVPAAMLVIGSTLAKMPLKDMISDGWAYVTTALRLVGVPLLVFAVGGIFIKDPYILAITALLSGMPAASSGTMMCLAYGGDVQAMARGTFLTTVLSLVTLPIVALIVA